MKSVFLIFSLVITVLSAGCASIKQPVGTSDIPNVFDGRWAGVYAKLTPSGFSDYCLFGSQYVNVGSAVCHPNLKYNPTVDSNYFSLADGKPVYSTLGMTCASAYLYNSKGNRVHTYRWNSGRTKEKKCNSPNFLWKKDKVLSKYLTYALVFPFITSSKEYEFYFDWDKASAALNKAVSGGNYDSIESSVRELNARYMAQLMEKRESEKEARIAAAELIKREEERKRYEEMHRRAEEERLANSRKMIIQTFDELSKRPKKIGDKVCRRDNLYGFVEGVSGDNVQVRLVGKALDVDEYFFFGKGGSFYSRDIKEIGWFDSRDFAECGFDINY